MAIEAHQSEPRRGRIFRSFGLALITGAADDDCSAVGTYVQAGAQLGHNVLWVAPALFPMMVIVVYLAGKIGQVTGQGLFAVFRCQYPRWLLYTILAGVLVGNIIEAGADLGAMAAAVRIFTVAPHALAVIGIAAIALVLQIWGSYTLLRNVLRVMALTMLAYVGSALMARPRLAEVVHGTLVPTLHWDRNSLAILVAMIGSSLSAYLFTWQSNEEVEEKIAAGQTTLQARKGTTREALKTSLWDSIAGMFLSSIVMYFIVLASALTLFATGKHNDTSAIQAAEALKPLAGNLAAALFAIGIVGLGFLAVPVMTAGAAYDVCQSTGWRNGLNRKFREAKRFYALIALFTTAAVGLNFIGINPMKALVLAGIVQGFSTPPLMLLIMQISGRTSIMGDKANGKLARALGWATTVLLFAAAVSLVASWMMH
jgi:Mn2+/Fe2+ NRAMP family transporter